MCGSARRPSITLADVPPSRPGSGAASSENNLTVLSKHTRFHYYHQQSKTASATLRARSSSPSRVQQIILAPPKACGGNDGVRGPVCAPTMLEQSSSFAYTSPNKGTKRSSERDSPASRIHFAAFCSSSSPTNCSSMNSVAPQDLRPYARR